MKFFIKIIFFLFCAALILFLLPSKAKDVKRGNRRYKQQRYAEALRQYASAAKRDPESDIVNFNTGAAFYKKGDFEKTLLYFKKALLTDDKSLKEKAHYNLGNVFYKIGMDKKDTDIKVTVTSFEQSLFEYTKALKLNKENKDAQFNYQYVEIGRAHV